MISKEQLEQARAHLKRIGPMRIVVKLGAEEGSCNLENKATSYPVASDISEEEPYADLIAFMLNNASDLLDNAKAVAV